jgi:hypothetical protein
VLNSTNLAIQANEVSPESFRGISFGIKKSTTVVTNDVDQNNIFVKLPRSILSNNKKGSVRIGFMYFANNNLFQPKTKLKGNTTASKEVLSSTVYSTDTSSLSEPVTLKFRNSEGREKGLNKSTCVYWHESGKLIYILIIKLERFSMKPVFHHVGYRPLSCSLRQPFCKTFRRFYD